MVISSKMSLKFDQIRVRANLSFDQLVHRVDQVEDFLSEVVVVPVEKEVLEAPI